MNPLPITAPPSARDFEIFEQHQILFLSTRNIAQKHRLSQTRVRQLITRVANWLADHLPAKTEASREAETRLAQHLAAAQLRRQIEVLQSYFDATGDPKYLRHQTRVIASLARLGIVPGTIDSLAADFTAADLSDREADIPVCHPTTPSPSDARGAGLRPASEVSEELATSTAPVPDSCPLSPAPSLRACSPPEQQTVVDNWATADNSAATPDHSQFSDDSMLDPETTLQGLAIMERRLLTLLDETPADNHDRRSSLHEVLENVRRNQAIFELRLSPGYPGATIVDPAQSGALTPAAVDSRI